MDHQSDIAELTAYLEERLDEGRRQEVRRHLLECAGCREAAAAIDPSIIFMAPAVTAPEIDATDAAFFRRFDATLRSRLEAEPVRRRGPLARLFEVPRLAYAAPVLGAAILAGMLFVNPGGILRPIPGDTAVVAVPPSSEAVIPDRPGRGHRLPTAAEDVASLPTLEEVSSPNARVYRLDVPVSAVASGDAGAVYFVVDESINF